VHQGAEKGEQDRRERELVDEMSRTHVFLGEYDFSHYFLENIAFLAVVNEIRK
jgi:hypothetical protein